MGDVKMEGTIMAKKYEQLACDIVEQLGGSENISRAYHCQTRLRFNIKSDKAVNKEAIEKLEGVAKVVKNAGVYQVVIGTHVKDVFEEIEKIVTSNNEDSNDNKEKQSFIGGIIDFVASAFGPVIPALSGAGMVKALLALLMVFKVISAESQTYYVLSFFADAIFYFLPMLLAYTIAQKLKCSPILAAAVAGIMMHPNWATLVTTGDPVKLFSVIPLTLTRYTSSVIPIILVILVQSYVEKLFKKWIPKSVELVFVPMLTFLVMGTLALSVLGPIGSIVGGYLAIFFTFLSTNASWAPALLIGAFLPLMVMFGLHNGVAPLGVMQMSELGYDSIFGPGCVCSNIAQATAGLVVSLRTKDKKAKQLAASGSITAYMGITEPILYGINLPKKYPLVASMIGGGLGGLYAGITQTHRFATGSSGLPAVFLYIGDDTMRFFYNILIALVISSVSTAIITYFLSLKYEKDEEKDVKTEKTSVHQSLSKGIIMNPVNGLVKTLKEAKDEVFASGVLGEGVVVEPKEGKVVAPFNGQVVSLFPTKHAIGLVSDTGVEVLIHIGIDTVQLEGKYFEALVQEGDKVQAGQELINFDMAAIETAGFSTQVMVIITNSSDYSSISTLATGKVAKETRLISLSV